ncbi:Rieske 2Fe-2S domain-containing protein [Couchioplanes caeruleus]|uniref:ubiquinol-cytochrome c reductase iron-sulfur subunit n=1 Tax=Couchioplanes caeruleus TaxID=56438 RepID=UPI00201C782F|nr:Rieske 2Fe-2S domain-containing protein [Couchioplanes caeruleus]UQU62615.1 Rieske 2Fe-2S domain-containing protein [Couchioplanes caeruleus]
MTRARGPMSGEKGAVRRIRLAFGAAVLGAVGFAVTYSLGGNTQLLGVSLGLAFAGLAYGLAAWGRRLLPTGGYVEQKPGLSAPPRRRDLLAEAMDGPESPLGRRGLVGMLLLGAGSIGVALLFPLRSLLSFRRPDPVTMLRHTAWQAGTRLVTPEGTPVRLTDIGGETIQIVVPEGHIGDGDTPAFVVRLDPERLRQEPGAGRVGDVVAYSLLCTHAGCPVALYEQTTARMLCPCHQSTFDLNRDAAPIAGPAARPLPGLPIEVGTDGYLRARGDFTAPPGAGFWSYP